MVRVPRQISRPVASQSGPFACPCQPSGPLASGTGTAVSPVTTLCGSMPSVRVPQRRLITAKRSGRVKCQEVLSNTVLSRLQTTIGALMVYHSSGPPRSVPPSQADLSGTGQCVADVSSQARLGLYIGLYIGVRQPDASCHADAARLLIVPIRCSCLLTPEAPLPSGLSMLVCVSAPSRHAFGALAGQGALRRLS